MTEQCEKGWMTIEDRCSPIYREGVDKFIAFAYKNKIRNSQFCLCPCRRCRNRKSMTFALVRHDLIDYGMLDSYVFWSLHGENSKPRSASAFTSTSYVNQNNEADTVEEETVVEEVVEESRRDDRLNDFVDNAFGIFEGLNENVNAGDSEHPFQEPNVGEKYNKYQKLAEEKIYPTCENSVTTLSVIVELHHVKNMNKKWPEFAKEARNVWLGISTDGFNPRGIQCASYSCWPVILVPYNLPPSLCKARGDIVHHKKVNPNERRVYIEQVYEKAAIIWDAPQGHGWCTLSHVPLPNWLKWAEDRLSPIA